MADAGRGIGRCHSSMPFLGRDWPSKSFGALFADDGDCQVRAPTGAPLYRGRSHLIVPTGREILQRCALTAPCIRSPTCDLPASWGGASSPGALLMPPPDENRQGDANGEQGPGELD